jgi:fermentation-respiration switch protein FrsA (DUF1100 family)
MNSVQTTDQYTFGVLPGVTRESVTYSNRYGVVLAADLYLPAGFDPATRYPAIVVGPPYGGVKEQAAGVHANQLAGRGFVAVAFDPSHNGESGGEPRHISSPDLFVEDFSAGVDYLGTRPFVDRDRIGALGVCGSGGFAIAAAQVDRRIKALATVSMYDISRIVRNGFADSTSDEDRDAMLDGIGRQRWSDFEDGTVKLTERGAPTEVDENTHPIAREFYEYYSTPRGYHPNSITAFTVTSAPSFMNFALLAHVETVSPRPILFVIGENAHSRYFSEDAYAAAAEPKELYVVPGAGHVDLYDRTDLIPVDKLAAFFAEHLA